MFRKLQGDFECHVGPVVKLDSGTRVVNLTITRTLGVVETRSLPEDYAELAETRLKELR